MTEIVLMHDEASVAQVLRLAFELEGYAVMETEGAGGTIELLRTHPRPVVALLQHRVTENRAIEVLAAALPSLTIAREQPRLAWQVACYCAQRGDRSMR